MAQKTNRRVTFTITGVVSLEDGMTVQGAIHHLEAVLAILISKGAETPIATAKMKVAVPQLTEMDVREEGSDGR